MAISAINADYVIMHPLHPQTVVVDTPTVHDQNSDQRQSQRHQLSQTAIVSVLGTPTQVLQGEIRNVSKGGTQLRLDRPLGIGSLLRIEYDNNLLLGEVVYCQQEEADWAVGIRVEHVLSGLAALAEALGPR